MLTSREAQCARREVRTEKPLPFLFLRRSAGFATALVARHVFAFGIVHLNILRASRLHRPMGVFPCQCTLLGPRCSRTLRRHRARKRRSRQRSLTGQPTETVSSRCVRCRFIFSRSSKVRWVVDTGRTWCRWGSCFSLILDRMVFGRKTAVDGLEGSHNGNGDDLLRYRCDVWVSR